MDMEEIEHQIADSLHVTTSLGLLSMESYHEYKHAVVQGMLMFGTLFFKSLSSALYHAGVNDSVKILNMWQSDAEQYSILYRVYKAKSDAEQHEKSL